MDRNEKLKKAHRKAVETLNNSYAPYSNLHVASFLSTDQGDFVGVNVENASYGSTICAERSAILSAISQKGPQVSFEFLIVISDSPQGPIPPCGMCLQVIKEFVGPDFPIYLGTPQGLSPEQKLSDFLPRSFGSDMLKK